MIFSTFNVFSQDLELRKTPKIEGKIVYTDSTIEIGKVWLANSAFKPRLKIDEDKKSKKVDYKKIDKIIIYPESNKERVFQYLHNNYNKFEIFAELVYKDDINIYVASKNNGTDLFYSEIDRETINEKFIKTNSENFNPSLNNTPNSLGMPYEEEMVIYSSYLNSPSFQFYIQKNDNPKLMRVEKNKKFLKKSEGFFSDCPNIINDLKEDKIQIKDLPEFIEHYKKVCLEKEE